MTSWKARTPREMDQDDDMMLGAFFLLVAQFILWRALRRFKT